MNSITIIEKKTYSVLQEKHLDTNQIYVNSEFYKNLIKNTLTMVKEMEAISTYNEYILFKIEGKATIYRKSNANDIAVIIISDKKAFKKQSLIDISGVFLDKLNSEVSSLSFEDISKVSLHYEDYFDSIVQGMTLNFIECLRKNKLFCKFIYFNHNSSAAESLSYKRVRGENTSIVLCNSAREDIKLEGKELSSKSAIREKELFLSEEKRASQPLTRNSSIKSNYKPAKMTTKRIKDKQFESNVFLKKYVAS